MAKQDELKLFRPGVDVAYYKSLYNSYKKTHPRIAKLLQRSCTYEDRHHSERIPLRDVNDCLARSYRNKLESMEEPVLVRPTLKLCSTCNDMIQKANETRRDATKYKFEHHSTSAALNESVNFGCGMCQRLQAELLQRDITLGSTPHPSVYAQYIGNQSSLTEHVTREFSLTMTCASVKLLKWTFLNKAVDTHLTRTALSPSTQQVDWDLVRSWLYRCRSFHAKCGRIVPAPRQLPTRLVEVQIVDHRVRARLRCRFKDPNLEYVTLSHCWGPHKIFTLNVDNLDQLCVDIPVKRLPQSFQDAMWVTIKLGIRYIWIDSLCICQGPSGQQDWLKELPLMSSIYRNCYCNIAASGFPDGRNGLFVPRQSIDIIPQMVHATPVQPPDLRASGKGIDYFVVEGDLEGDSTNNPLNSRAWAVQERSLSPCTISFGQQQVYWECCEIRCSELFPDGCLPIPSEKRLTKLPWDHRGNDFLIKQLSESNYAGLFKQFESAYKGGELYSLWWQVVSLFSTGKLSRYHDKLPAIAGIATYFETLLKDQYLAGLWQKTILYDLVWEVENTSKLRSQVEYRAPSWSWASIDATISFAAVNYLRDHPQEERIVCAQYIDAQVYNIGADRCGPILTGSLQLCGLLLPFQCYISTSNSRLQGRIYDSPMLEYPLLSISFDMSIDNEQEQTQIQEPPANSDSIKVQACQNNAPFLNNGPMFLFPIASNASISEYHGYQVRCLILGFCDGKKGQYIRLGVCDMHQNVVETVLAYPRPRPRLDEKFYDHYIESTEGTEYDITII